MDLIEGFVRSVVFVLSWIGFCAEADDETERGD